MEMSFTSAIPGRDYVGELCRDEVKLARLKANLDRRPEGFMRFVYALCLMNRALAYDEKYRHRGPHSGRTRDLYRMAADAYAEAADTPGLVNTRFVAYEGAAMCYTIAGKPRWAPNDPEPECLKRAAEMVRRRLALPDRIHTARLDVLVRVGKNAGDLTTARRVLDEWGTRAPDDPTYLERRAEVEECLMKLRRDPDLPPEVAPAPRLRQTR
jgi:hypothetical protein